MSRASAILVLSVLTAAAVASAGCTKMKAPWTPRPGAGRGAAGPAADSAAADSLSGDSLPPAGPRDAGAAEGGKPERGRPAPADSAGPAPPSVEELQEQGPSYVPYEVSPQLLPGDWLSTLLSDTLAPVVDRHDEISVQEFALFWVLVDREGQVRDVVLHTTSRSDPFDQAARAVAEHLRYRPALSGGQRVPVWVLARISLLMR